MSNFNFKEELEDQKKELVEQYGEEIAVHHWNGEDYYDGEYCMPPSHRWSLIISWSAAINAAANQFSKWHTSCGYLLMLAYNTHMSKITEFFPQLIQKGYTEREIQDSCKPHQQRKPPAWFNGTYAEYMNEMHDFLNGL